VSADASSAPAVLVLSVSGARTRKDRIELDNPSGWARAHRCCNAPSHRTTRAVPLMWLAALMLVLDFDERVGWFENGSPR
jgi:hypothetical protein